MEKIHSDSVVCYIFLVLFLHLLLVDFLLTSKPSQLFWENLEFTNTVL